MEYPNRLYDLRMSVRKSQKDVGKHLMISQSEYSRIEKGSRKLGVHLEPLKEYFSKHSKREINNEDIFLEPTVSDAVNYNMSNRFDFPIYGKAQLDGSIIFDKVIDMIERPTGLRHNKDAYACKVSGTDMMPRLAPGNLLIIDPQTIPMHSQLCLVSFKCNPDCRYIREFIECDMASKKVRLKTLNPLTESTHNIEEIDKIHTVKGIRFF